MLIIAQCSLHCLRCPALNPCSAPDTLFGCRFPSYFYDSSYKRLTIFVIIPRPDSVPDSTATTYRKTSNPVLIMHETQNPARYLRWVKEHGLQYFSPFADDENPQTAMNMGLSTARRIWNATPLKINQYRPDPHR